MMLGWRGTMFVSRSLIHGWSHCDAHLARVETRFVAARRATRHKRFAARHAVTRRSPQRDAVLVAPRRRVIAPWRGVVRPATSRTSECARTTPRCDESDIRVRENDAALRRGGHQSARGQRRAAARWTSERARTTSRCGEA
jgi:hypothetical protein